MTILKDPLSESIGTELTRRSFLGWTAKVGIIAVTTKIIPVQSLDDLECIPCNITASDIVRREQIAYQQWLIRSELWSKQLQEALMEVFDGVYSKASQGQEIS